MRLESRGGNGLIAAHPYAGLLRMMTATVYDANCVVSVLRSQGLLASSAPLPSFRPSPQFRATLRFNGLTPFEASVRFTKFGGPRIGRVDAHDYMLPSIIKLVAAMKIPVPARNPSVVMRMGDLVISTLWVRSTGADARERRAIKRTAGRPKAESPSKRGALFNWWNEDRTIKLRRAIDENLLFQSQTLIRVD